MNSMKYEEKLQPFDSCVAQRCAEHFYGETTFTQFVKELKSETHIKRVINLDNISSASDSAAYLMQIRYSNFKHILLISPLVKQVLSVTKSGKLWFFDWNKNLYFTETPFGRATPGKFRLNADMWSYRHGWTYMGHEYSAKDGLIGLFRTAFDAVASSQPAHTKLETLAYMICEYGPLPPDEVKYIAHRITNIYWDNADENEYGHIQYARLTTLPTKWCETILGVCNDITPEWYLTQKFFKTPSWQSRTEPPMEKLEKLKLALIEQIEHNRSLGICGDECKPVEADAPQEQPDAKSLSPTEEIEALKTRIDALEAQMKKALRVTSGQTVYF